MATPRWDLTALIEAARTREWPKRSFSFSWELSKPLSCGLSTRRRADSDDLPEAGDYDRFEQLYQDSKAKHVKASVDDLRVHRDHTFEPSINGRRGKGTKLEPIERKEAEWTRRKASSETAACSFKPELVSSQERRRKRQEPLHERAAQDARASQLKLERLRQRKVEWELRQCTFSPQTNTPRASKGKGGRSLADLSDPRSQACLRRCTSTSSRKSSSGDAPLFFPPKVTFKPLLANRGGLLSGMQRIAAMSREGCRLQRERLCSQDVAAARRREEASQGCTFSPDLSLTQKFHFKSKSKLKTGDHSRGTSAKEGGEHLD